MNTITLKGVIRNIQHSHEINGVEYKKAELIVPRQAEKDDIISLRFKSFACPYQEDQEINLKGNLRSYSQLDENGKSKVEIYVFSYFDIPHDEEEKINEVEISGRICKINPLRTTHNGKQTIQFILANNITGQDFKQKINNYIPVVVWGKLARDVESFQVNDQVKVIGQFHSREYKKALPNNEIEIRVAHEVVALDVSKIN